VKKNAADGAVRLMNEGEWLGNWLVKGRFVDGEPGDGDCGFVCEM
jgi:hypothetical protein